MADNPLGAGCGHFHGLGIVWPSGICGTRAEVRSQSTGQLLRIYCLSVRQAEIQFESSFWMPRHDRRTAPKPHPAGFQHFCRMSWLRKELDQPCSTIDANRLTGHRFVPVVETVGMWESRRDSQRAWEGWEAGIMALHAFHTPSFPWSAFRPARLGERVRHHATKQLS